MVALGGGGIAAFGLRYQYLVTAEYVLAFLRNDLALIPHANLVTEPLHKKDDGKDDDRGRRPVRRSPTGGLMVSAAGRSRRRMMVSPSRGAPVNSGRTS